MSHRRGFTLIEILVALALVSLLVLIGFPKVSSALTKNNVRASRTQVVNMLAKARTSATITNRKTWLKISGNKAFILARPPRVGGGGGTSADTLGVVEDFSARYGTSVKLGASDPDSIAFDPRGIGSGWAGARATIAVSKGSYRDSVMVDGKGRVLK